MDRLSAMRAFISVATLGSFAGAARQLRLSPSTVTRLVAQLEHQLGTTLLGRTTRAVRLTEPGRAYLESCRQILDDLDAAERSLRGENAEPRGELIVAAPIVFGRMHVLPIIGRMLGAHPLLSARLRLSDRNVHLVEEGVDVAVRIGELADSSLMAIRLGAVDRVLVASPAYLEQRGVPAAPADLGAHDIIAFESLDATDEWRFAGATIRLQPRLAVNSADAAIAAAEAGLGITRALSYQVRAAVLAGRLVPLLRPHAPPPAPVSAVHPPRRVASANVAAFTKAALAHFRANAVTPIEEWA